MLCVSELSGGARGFDPRESRCTGLKVGTGGGVPAGAGLAGEIQVPRTFWPDRTANLRSGPRGKLASRLSQKDWARPMFESVDAICEEFGLKKGLSRGRLRTELRKRMLSIHSDRTGGEFPNEEVKRLYLRMQEALDHLDAPKGGWALQRVDANGAALEQRIAALETASQLRSSPIEESAKRSRQTVASRYRAGRIGSAVFAAISVSILSFSKNLAQYPMFSSFANRLWFRNLLVIAFLLSGIAFISTWLSEQVLRRRVSALLSEDGIAWTLRQCVYSYSDEDTPGCEITQRRLMSAIQSCSFGWRRSRISRWLRGRLATKIPRDTAGEIAKAHVACLLERGVLKRQGIRAAEPLYVISSSQVKEITDDRDAVMFDPDVS
jgi:hypothetical protein